MSGLPNKRTCLRLGRPVNARTCKANSESS
ncbi:Uncharacterised protein [Vibrio cholerae]|nr:Uncharacterised protein [Vibrio cholerae]